MNTSCQKENHQTRKNSEAGNALVYVLIAIALFAALTLTLGRETDSGQANALNRERAQLYATQLIAYATQARSAIDQMTFTGLTVDDIDYSLPGTAGFTGGVADFRKLYHPQGGGLIARPLPAEASVPNAITNWHIGQFNNVEWSETTAEEVIAVAAGLRESVCAEINNIITGDPTIPTISSRADVFFIDDDLFGFTNQPFETSDCPACEGNLSLCILDNNGFYYFYNILIER